MISVFVDGAAGTTGLDIAERLETRPEFTLLRLDDVQRKQPAARRDALNAADIAILCLPDDAAREAVALIDDPRTRVIDASSAHRTADGWTYGFPELGFDVAGSTRVSNPGCYPTGFLALVAPLVRAGVIPADWPVTVNAVSGYSGGGKAMIAAFECDDGAQWQTYALSLRHKHIPEMHRHSGLLHAPLFAPSVARSYRGMVVEVPLQLAAMPGRPSVQAIRDVLAETHSGPLVTLCGEPPDPLMIDHAAGSDRVELFVTGHSGQVRLIAALDNLGKGASGAVIQTLNAMVGLPETAGLQLNLLPGDRARPGKSRQREALAANPARRAVD